MAARVYVICEGSTEEQFIKTVLSPFLSSFKTYLSPCLIGKPGHKGGNVTYERLKLDVTGFLKRDSGAFCTTMIDYFGLPSDFPGKPVPKNSDATEKAKRIEDSLGEKIRLEIDERWRPERFIPYVQMHEFEGLLFSDPSAIASELEVSLHDQLKAVRDKFATPEDIDEGQTTAPSKRIKRIYPAYDKPRHPILIAQRIGINTILDCCLHFKNWVSNLRQLPNLGLSD
jgi:hypothetical protein